jgi:hypothetical protein
LASFEFGAHHPGFITLIPVMGTVLIICFKGEEDWVTRTLSRPAMVYLGLLSYSLYLWHYPIFAFGRMAEVAPSGLHKGIWIALTLFLSMMSYHLVEKPFRSKRVSRRVLIFGLSLSSSVVICVSLYWIRGEGIPSRGNYLQDLIRDSKTRIVRQDGADCFSGRPRGRVFGISDSCVFEYSPGSSTLILVGDSHADALAESVRVLASENHLNFVLVTFVGCPHINRSDSLWCKDRSEALRPFLKKFQNPTIIYSARLPIYLAQLPIYLVGEPVADQDIGDESDMTAEQKQLFERQHHDHLSNAIVETLTAWVDDGYGLVIVYPVPEQGFNVRSLLKWRFPFASNAAQLPTLSSSYDVYKKRVASSYSALDKVTGSQVRRVYPEKIFCREETGRCIASESDRIYFDTDNHVAPLASDLIVGEVAVELKLQVPKSFRK